MKIKIVGAGSAGNHMAYAFKDKASITMTDNTMSALSRSKNRIYIPRYKKWDKNISLELERKENNKHDCIIISTPPNTHLKLLKKNLNQSNIFLIEKPICEPNKKTIISFQRIFKKNRSKIFLCGYNHRLFPSTIKLKNILKKIRKKISYINVNFKESTEGFLKAHNWFKDLSDSYLSKQNLGGGALFEHSHALNLAEYILEETAFKTIFKDIEYLKNRKNSYDSNARLIFNNKKIIIEISQNFQTLPTEKNIIITGKNFFLKLIYNYKLNNDLLIYINNDGKIKKKIFFFKKKRSDDFKYEADYLIKLFKEKNKKIKTKLSNILSADKGLTTVKNILNVL